MPYKYEDTRLNAIFQLSSNQKEFEELHRNYPNVINIHWNRSDHEVFMRINHELITLEPNQITTSTYNQKVAFESAFPDTFSFNRDFYCIVTHDAEVSCNGILFFGTVTPPKIKLHKEELKKFNLMLEVFKDEFSTRDNIQGEMLRMLLKRFIIKTTRLYKNQNNLEDVPKDQLDIIREFNVLVELHFREKHQVSDYADLLFKSSKTISNYFAKHSNLSPLNVIQERIILEAKKLLHFTDKSIKEIAYELGYRDPATLSRLFKNGTDMSPAEFRIRQKTE